MAREVLGFQRGAYWTARPGTTEVVNERSCSRIGLCFFSGR